MTEQLPEVPIEQCKAKHLSYDIQQIGVLQLTLPLPNQRTNPFLFLTQDNSTYYIKHKKSRRWQKIYRASN